MSKRFLLISFLAASILFIQAQKVTVKMLKETLDLNNSTYYVDSVIDARNQGECIGYTLRGGDFRQTAVIFEKPFCQELQDLFSRSIPADEQKIPLTLRINKFLLSTYYFSEIYHSVVEVNISFIIKKDGKYVELYRGMAYSESSGGYGPGSAAPIIAATLGNCFQGFLIQDEKNLLSSLDIPEKELSENPLYNQKFLIEQVNELKRGIYWTFSDFINYRVDTLRSIKVEYIPETEKSPTMAKVVFERDNSWIGKAWGFSDGQTSYININGNYYPMYWQDSVLRFKALREGTKLNNYTPYVAGALVGGLIGAMFGVTVIPMFLNPVKDAILECQLELNSGLILPVDLIEYKKMDSRMLLYMTKYQKEENEMEIYLDGVLKCKLKRNSYYLLVIPPYRQRVELCLRSNGREICESYTPIQYDAGVFICEVKNNQPPSRSEAKAEIRTSILNQIATGGTERKCPEK